MSNAALSCANYMVQATSKADSAAALSSSRSLVRPPGVLAEHSHGSLVLVDGELFPTRCRDHPILTPLPPELIWNCADLIKQLAGA